MDISEFDLLSNLFTICSVSIDLLNLEAMHVCRDECTWIPSRISASLITWTSSLASIVSNTIEKCVMIITLISFYLINESLLRQNYLLYHGVSYISRPFLNKSKEIVFTISLQDWLTRLKSTKQAVFVSVLLDWWSKNSPKSSLKRAHVLPISELADLRSFQELEPVWRTSELWEWIL